MADGLFDLDDEILKSKLLQVNKLCAMDFTNFLVSSNVKMLLNIIVLFWRTILGFKDQESEAIFGRMEGNIAERAFHPSVGKAVASRCGIWGSIRGVFTALGV